MATIDPSYRLLACRYLREQLDRLTEELRGVRKNEDIEPVHQARVATRRMRAAFRIFDDCFGPRELSKWQKRVRKLTKGLGAARDKDVQIEFVETFLGSLDKDDKRCRPGVERLLLRLRQDRQALQPQVIATLEKLCKDSVFAEMHGELAKTLFLLKSRDVHIQSPFVFERAGEHIRGRASDLFSYEHTLADPAQVEGHHRMRIAAKRLRYTMEICSPAYDKALAPFVKVVKKIQTLLGDIHDCDVWVDNLEAFMEQERLRAIDYFGHARPYNLLHPGLSLVRQERRTHREQTFNDLVAYWTNLGEERFWAELERTLASREPAAARAESQDHDKQTNGTEEDIQNDSAVE